MLPFSTTPVISLPSIRMPTPIAVAVVVAVQADRVLAEVAGEPIAADRRVTTVVVVVGPASMPKCPPLMRLNWTVM